MNCPQCGAALIDMTVHGGPMNFVCTRGHWLDALMPEPEAPPESPKFLDRAAKVLKSVFSRNP